MPLRFSLVAAVLTVLCGLVAVPSMAARSLTKSAHLTILGGGARDRAGTSVAGAGDVNGDGTGDVLVGAPGARARRGAAYVVFGSRKHLTIHLSKLGHHGFAISGSNGPSRDAVGTSVSGAGDVNGDGLADVIVGAPGADPLGRRNDGAAYVVFGKRSNSRVNLPSLGSRGYAIEGGGTGSIADHTGIVVANGGDLNGDRRPDALVSAPGVLLTEPVVCPVGMNCSPTVLEGGVFVVYGKSDPGAIDLASLGSAGYLIAGADSPGFTLPPVAGPGDMNGDGRRDIASTFEFGGEGSVGGTFVLFGGAHSGTVKWFASATANPAIPGTGFFVDFAKGSLAGAGDVNHDHLADLLIGVPHEGCTPPACPLGQPPRSRRDDAGAAYLVFGTRSSAPGALGGITDAVHFTGARSGQEAGTSLVRLGDVNGDGVADFALGAPGPGRGVVFRGNRTRFPGAVFVVYGRRHMHSLDLAQLGKHGLELRGQARDRAGQAVGTTGGRRPELVVGAPGADHGRGAVYVVSL
jgi:hypothetical protein